MRVHYYVVLALGLAGCDTFTGQDCSETVEQTIDLDAPLTPAVQLKVDSCQVDVDACGALCTRVMTDNNLIQFGGGGGQPTPGAPGGFPDTSAFVPYTKCAVTFEGSTTHVDIAYTQTNGGPNCPVFDQAGGAPK